MRERIVAGRNVKCVTTAAASSGCVPAFGMRDSTASAGSVTGLLSSVHGAFSALRRFPLAAPARGPQSGRVDQRHAEETPMNAFALLVTFAFFVPIALTIAAQLATLDEAA